MDSTHSRIIRQATLKKLADITAIERGTLTEEYRERIVPDGNVSVRRGPYFKHQCWENGKNRSVRVPSGQVAQVREHIENGQRFDELTATLEQLALEEGRSQRAVLSDMPVPADIESKKNSTRNVSKKGTGKRKPLSPPFTKRSPRKE
jgi:hypothetical protein